jgi:hypothetical protein
MRNRTGINNDEMSPEMTRKVISPGGRGSTISWAVLGFKAKTKEIIERATRITRRTIPIIKHCCAFSGTAQFFTPKTPTKIPNNPDMKISMVSITLFVDMDSKANRTVIPPNTIRRIPDTSSNIFPLALFINYNLQI